MDDVFEINGNLRGQIFAPTAWQAMQAAVTEALETRIPQLRAPHLFMGLISQHDPAILKWGQFLRADLKKLHTQFQELFYNSEEQEKILVRLHREFLSDQVIAMLRSANRRSCEHSRTYISTIDILTSVILDPDSVVADCFERIGIRAETLHDYALIAENSVPPTRKAA